MAPRGSMSRERTGSGRGSQQSSSLAADPSDWKMLLVLLIDVLGIYTTYIWLGIVHESIFTFVGSDGQRSVANCPLQLDSYASSCHHLRSSCLYKLACCTGLSKDGTFCTNSLVFARGTGVQVFLHIFLVVDTMLGKCGFRSDRTRLYASYHADKVLAPTTLCRRRLCVRGSHDLQ